MRYTKVLAGLALGITVVSAQQARAGSVTFDFWGAGILDPNYVNIATLTPSNHTPLAGITASGGALTQDFVLGLGVGNNNLIDPTQSIDFHFNPPATVDSITFTSFYNVFGGTLGDNAKLLFSSDDGTSWFTVTPTIITGFDPLGDPTYQVTAAVAANVTDFEIETSDITDQFGIGSLTVNYDNGSGSGSGQLSAAPLPAAASSGLGVLALLGIGAFIRRRRPLAS